VHFDSPSRNKVYGECEQPLLSSDVRRTAAEQPLEAVVAPPLQPPATFSDPPPVAVAVTDSKNEVIVSDNSFVTFCASATSHHDANPVNATRL